MRGGVIVAVLLSLAGCSNEQQQPSRCGTTAGLQDAFDGDALGSSWRAYASSLMQVQVAGGALEISYSDDGTRTDVREGGIESQFAYTLLGSVLSIRIDSWPGDNEVFLVARRPLHDDSMIEVGLVPNASGNKVVARQVVGGRVTVLGERPYDPARDLYLVIRETNGEVQFDASNEPDTSEPVASSEAPFTLEHVHPGVRVRATEAIVAEGVVVLDEFNTAVKATATCTMSALTEDFSSEAPDSRWALEGDGVVWGDGSLELPTSSALRTVARYDLRESELVLSIDELPSGPQQFTAFYLVDATDQFVDGRLLIVQGNDVVAIGQYIDGAPSGLMARLPNPAAGPHRWTIRGQDGAVELVTESDQQQHVYRLAPRVNLNQVTLEILAPSMGGPLRLSSIEGSDSSESEAKGPD